MCSPLAVLTMDKVGQMAPDQAGIVSVRPDHLCILVMHLFHPQTGSCCRESCTALGQRSWIASTNVNIFFNMFCAGTAPEGRGRTGHIKKGLLYWFITTVAQQCMIPRRRSSLSGLVVAFLDDPIVIPNYPYQDHEQDHPSRDRVGRQVKCSWKWKWEELQLHGNRTLRKQDPQMLTWSV